MSANTKEYELVMIDRGKTKRTVYGIALSALCFISPILMGGCPEFGDEFITVANGATQSIILGDTAPDQAIESATRSIASAVIDQIGRASCRERV